MVAGRSRAGKLTVLRHAVRRARARLITRPCQAQVADKTPPTDGRAAPPACGLGAARCRKALEGSGGDVEVALAALIDAGEVQDERPGTDLVSDELFGRASHRQMERLYTRRRQGVRGIQGVPGNVASSSARPNKPRSLRR